MKILVHWHPQGAFVARAIFFCNKYLNCNDGRLHVGLLRSSSFLSHLNSLSDTYIDNLCQHKGARISFEKVSADNDLVSFTQYLKFRQRCGKKKQTIVLSAVLRELADNAILDSLGRGLEECYSLIGYMTANEKTRAELFELRSEYMDLLISDCVEEIKKFQPEILVVSHGTYDHYVAPFIAGITCGIPVMVVNGGCNMAYVINPSKHDIDDPCIANAFAQIVQSRAADDEFFKACLPEYIIRKISESPSAYLKNTSTGVIAKSKIYRTLGANTAPLAMLPIFAELNHHNCLKQRTFKSRYEWLQWVVDTSASAGKCLYLYLHPMTEAYGQKDFSLALIKRASEGKNVEIRILDHLDKLERLVFEQVMLPLTMASSVSLELNSYGKHCCVSNYSTSSALEYSSRVDVGMDYQSVEYDFFRIMSMTLPEGLRQAATDCLRFNSYNVKHSQDYYIRKSFDKLFWFGSYSKNSDQRFIDLLSTYITGLSCVVLNTNNFDQLIVL